MLKYNCIQRKQWKTYIRELKKDRKREREKQEGEKKGQGGKKGMGKGVEWKRGRKGKGNLPLDLAYDTVSVFPELFAAQISSAVQCVV